MNYDERPRVAMNAKCLSKEMPDQLKLQPLGCVTIAMVTVHTNQQAGYVLCVACGKLKSCSIMLIHLLLALGLPEWTEIL